MWRNTYPPHQQVHIGDPDGRVALWLNERSCYDLAQCLRHDDRGHTELIEAAMRAYPANDEEDT